MPARPLSRRALLRGAGAAIALPFLDAMACSQNARTVVGTSTSPFPAGACSTDGGFSPTRGPRRLVYLFVPNGFDLARWTPTQEGPDYALTPTLSPLAPFKNDLLVLSGLSNAVTGTTGAFHTRATAAFLTCSPIRQDEIRAGTSVDQVAAAALAGATPLRSLELGTYPAHDTAVSCDGVWGCVYGDTIAWADPAHPLPKDVDPRSVFDRLFGSADTDAGLGFIARQRRRRSVLDFVLGDVQSVNARLGAGDRRKLDEYLSSIREVETLIAAVPPSLPRDATAPQSVTALADRFQAMIDLTVLALQTDRTRVVTLMHGCALFNYTYPFLGIPPSMGGHHSISHNDGDPTKLDAMFRIGTWEVQQLARLLGRMKAITEPDGTLLDNSLVYFSSDIANGNDHNSNNLPVLLAGRGGGVVRPGRHIRYRNNEPMGDLFLSMLASVGVESARFGATGTGPLAGLG